MECKLAEAGASDVRYNIKMFEATPDESKLRPQGTSNASAARAM